MIRMPCHLILSLLLVSTLHCSFAAATTTAHSLGQIPSAIESDKALKLFDSSMSNSTASDSLGAHPEVPGFGDDYLFQQLAPAGLDIKRLVLSSIRPWHQRPGSFVGLICVSQTAKAAEAARKYDAGNCQDLPGSADRKAIWVGVFEASSSGAPKLVSRSEAVSAPIDWSRTNIDRPAALVSPETLAAPAATPSSWKRFDLARFQFRPDDIGFGLRAGWSESYPGGGADFEALYLFHIEGNSLRVVLAQPMTFVRTTAGEWRRDGTRDHEVSDANNILIVLPDMTNGYYDLQLRQQHGKWRRTFRWSASQRDYQ